MLSHMIEKVHDRGILCRERTPTEEKVLGAFLYQSGLSYRKVERFVDGSYEAVRQCLVSCSLGVFRTEKGRETGNSHRRDQDENRRRTGLRLGGCRRGNVRDSTRRRFSRTLKPRALLFLKIDAVMSRCRGKPLVKVDRGPWYNRALDTLDCDYKKESFGERSLSESVFSLFKYTLLFRKEFPYLTAVACVRSTQRWLRAYSAFHNEVVLS